MTTIAQSAPESFEEAAAILAAAAAEGRPVRIGGGATKQDWGLPGPPAAIELSTTGLHEIVAHNTGDHTAIVQAGVPLATAQRAFAAAGQRLALDPPLGQGGVATVGGVIATADSGPLRHRYGGPRDLVLGMTVALSDGSIAKSGGTVIKNVAGYDLAKLFTGAFGTLGLILSVSLRLHPIPPASTTALGSSADPDRINAAAVALARSQLEFDAVDVAWRDGRGGLLARCAGPEHVRRGRRTARLMAVLELEGVDVTEDDAPLWERQRAGQRTREHAMARVAHAPSQLATVIRAAEACGATLVGRAALGLSYVEVAPDKISDLRRAVAPASTTILDTPAAARAQIDPWDQPAAPAMALMRSVKGRFDPTATCNPGVFVGGI